MLRTRIRAVSPPPFLPPTVGSLFAICLVYQSALNESLVGNISVQEFAQFVAQSPGKPPSTEEVEKIIKEVDLDGDGSINFNGEFAVTHKISFLFLLVHVMRLNPS
jgi:hypothetical protein